jgi:CDP-glycerol glycerophosphotransferase
VTARDEATLSSTVPAQSSASTQTTASTQSATSARSAADSFRAAADALAGCRRADERRRLLAGLLDGELRYYLDTLPDLPQESREAIVNLAADFAGGLGRDAKVLDRLPALTRLKWHLAERRLLTELVKVVRYERGKSDPAIVRNPIRRYVVYPYWKDEKLAIPAQVYRARDEVELRSRVEEVRWDDGRLVVSGDAFIHSVSSARRWTAVKGIILHSTGRRPIRLRARQRVRTGRGKGAGTWTGFTVTIDPRRLRGRRGWRDGVWRMDAAVFNAGVYRRAGLAEGVAGSAADPPHHYVAEGVRVVPENAGGHFTLRVETVRALATALRWSDDTLTVTGTVREGIPATLTLTLVSKSSKSSESAESAESAEIAVPVEASEGGEFGVAIPVPAGTEGIWKLLVDGFPLVAGEGLASARAFFDGREAVAEAGPGGYVRIRVRTARLSITGCSLAADGTLSLRAEHPFGHVLTHRHALAHGDASAHGGELVLRGSEHATEYRFGLRPTDGGREDGAGAGFEADVPLAAVPSLAGVLPLREGVWDLLFDDGSSTLPVTVVPETETGPELPQSAEVALRGITVERRDGGLTVVTTSDLHADELGAATRLREEARRQAARTGLREAVLFSCFNGRQYSDSTRAVHEELARRHPDLEQLWVVADGQVELPDTVRAVRLNGREWHEALASCRYIVANHRFGDWFRRHPDQTVLQTWHGTPLKKIGKDVKEVHFAYAPGMRKALQTNAAGPALPEWTHLVSPNPFSTEILRRAFGFQGEIIETGYPRNDILHSPHADAVRERVRARLGVPADRTLVLYAPTWRDDQFYGRGKYKLDWRIDLETFGAALGGDHTLMVRLHPHVVDTAPRGTLDVSTYPDIAELYLASDVLVTDYSSVMFDYANTRKPQLFFTYDLDHYRDTLRGFYFDFEAEAPGPLLRTSDELVEALRSLDAVTAAHKPAYDAFHDRFCALEDGHAAERVIDQVFPF